MNQAASVHAFPGMMGSDLKTTSQDKPLLGLSCFWHIFCDSDGKSNQYSKISVTVTNTWENQLKKAKVNLGSQFGDLVYAWLAPLFPL